MEYLYEVDGDPERKKHYGEIKREKMRDYPGEPTLFESINIKATKSFPFCTKMDSVTYDITISNPLALYYIENT